jgi:hypothetical protein
MKIAGLVFGGYPRAPFGAGFYKEEQLQGTPGMKGRSRNIVKMAVLSLMVNGLMLCMSATAISDSIDSTSLLSTPNKLWISLMSPL